MITLRNDILDVQLEESNLALTVTDRRGGGQWTTPGPGFELQVYDIPNQHYRWYSSAGSDINKFRYGDNPQSRCRIQIKKLSETQAAARVDFTTLDLGFELRLTLSGAELAMDIPAQGWNFSGEKASEVVSLDCFPLFGGRARGGEGYMVLPHFGGAVRYFADRPDRAERMANALAADPGSAYTHEMTDTPPDPNASQFYAAMTYGFQAAWRDLIAYPLWGTLVGDSGWAAYVPFGCGDADTAVVTAANRGKDRLCGVWGRFHYREHAHDRRVDEDRRLVLTFLHEKGLNFATIGRLYRHYMVEKAKVPALREKARASVQTDYMVGAYIMRPMLALKRYHYFNNPNPDGKGILDVYLTCDDLRSELQRWKKAGVERMLVQIVGANSEGHDGNYPTYFPLEPKVGGEEGFRRLVGTIKELNYRSSVHVSLRAAFRAAPDFRSEYILRDRDGALFFEGSGPGGDGYGACPAAAMPDLVKRTFPRLVELGLDGGMYTDFLLGVLFRCYHPTHPLTRRGYLDAVRAYLAECKRLFGATRAESAVAGIIDQVDWMARLHALDVGEALMRGAELTARGLVDETVPLELIVFHGLVMHSVDNTCLGSKDHWAYILKLIAAGAKPVEEPRGPQPQWDDLHVLEYRLICEQLRWLQLEFMEDLQFTGKLSQTRYSDGTVVWVNHGTEPIEAGGRKLPGRSLLVKPGRADQKEVFVTEDKSLTNRPAAVFPDGSIWPDGCPREGLVLEPGQSTTSFGMMIGKDFA